MERLKEKIAIVTGAANGIGLATSEAFAEEGATVCMLDIDVKKCLKEAEKLKTRGLNAISYTCDVGEPEQMQSSINEVLDKFGRIDVLVNNAAIARHHDITEMTEQEWDTLMNVNLKSVYRGIKYALPIMKSQRSGSVITLSSVQGFRSWNDWTAYASAKGAILSMTTQLAGQYGEFSVRFNTISPGAILTPMNEHRIKTEGKEFEKKSINQAAMKRMGTPKEVAMTAVFLASDESSFITGEDIKVDGGLSTLPRYM